jgi:hypothetical protein
MRTTGLLKRALTFSLLGSGMVLVAGCPAQPQRMSVERTMVPVSGRFLSQMSIADVTGGKAVTMASSTSEVSNDALRDALKRSLQEAGYLSPNPDGASILLRVGIVDVENPHQWSSIAKVITIIRYQLESKDGGKPLFDELITASCTRTLSDDVLAVRRVQHADECAVMNNIGAFLTKLSALN